MNDYTLSSFSLYGLKAVLVLEDNDGEFEVANAFRPGEAGTGTIQLDPVRVVDAIDSRKRGRLAPKRPVY